MGTLPPEPPSWKTSPDPGWRVEDMLPARLSPRTPTYRKQFVLSMKKKHTDNLGLDDLGNLIEEIARRRLPDGVLGGILAGNEGEIRQDAAIMLQLGFMRRNLDFVKAAVRRDRSAAMFHLELVVSIALTHCKARQMRKRIKEKLPPG